MPQMTRAFQQDCSGASQTLTVAFEIHVQLISRSTCSLTHDFASVFSQSLILLSRHRRSTMDRLSSAFNRMVRVETRKQLACGPGSPFSRSFQQLISSCR